MAAKKSISRGRQTSATVRRPASRRAAGSTSRRKPAGGRGRRSEGRDWTQLTQHRREIVALVLVALAVFAMVSLFGGDAAGSAGRGVRTGLVYAFGRLAVLVPLILVGVAVTTVFTFNVWRTYRFAGAVVLLFGVFLLVGAGGPPFASHGEELFVRAAFETRAGGLGEALYALFERVGGRVGVGILGWLTGLVGLMLATGVTAARVADRTKTAAAAMKQRTEQQLLRSERRTSRDAFPPDDPLRVFTGTVADDRGPDARTGRATPVRLGPVDLVAQGQSGSRGAAAGGGERQAFGDSFEEWSTGRSSATRGGPSSETLTFEKDDRVVDGEQAFADMYQSGPARGGFGVDTTAEAQPRVQRGGGETAVQGESLAGTEDVTVETPEGMRARSLREAVRADEQEPLPGLERPGGPDVGMESVPAYLLPERAMLRKSAPGRGQKSSDESDVGAVLTEALSQFGVEAKVIGMVVGPRVTRYELQLAPGTKVAKVSALKDDLAYALASTEIRILTPIPGMSAVGVEVPNQRPDFVTLGDIYREFPKSAGPLMVWLGKDISGKAVYADLTKLPHVLIAGTTGSGKSGCVNCLVSSVLLRSTPEQVRMIMVDPKKVELSHYDRIPHLLVPVVTNMKDAAGVLHNVVKEMEDRYELLELDHARSLAEANKMRAGRGEQALPYILIVIDELADLMMASPQEVEDYVIRLAQKSRAVGIHLVVATQRPSADVITGMIKANIPSRIAFAVSSQTDSRVILDMNGAETLLGMGDMLFKPLGSSHLQRVQGAYITEEEIATLVNHWRLQAEPQFREELLRRPQESKKVEEGSFDPDSDELLADAARLVVETGSASVSMLQRRLRVGYTRAGRLIDMLERRGIVGPWEGSKPRQIMMGRDDLDLMIGDLETMGPGPGGPTSG